MKGKFLKVLLEPIDKVANRLVNQVSKIPKDRQPDILLAGISKEIVENGRQLGELIGPVSKLSGLDAKSLLDQVQQVVSSIPILDPDVDESMIL